MEEKINAALEDVKQVLRRDGGDIELVGITEDNIVQVRLQGHCAGCQGARMTLKGIVEQILQEAVPEVKGVEAVD
ncbi:NifU family protein [Aminicella lysinilytica]|uniref:Fe-S cluster biogenesis protein NfuA n=1 Tax=Aminicella lysinilytica TaxID=433323 RepID=A0A4R6Q3H9_9FIRM|nr:NifU family protein [Aminicella lysinilytica]TDP55993.1 Fe-S cluster biogenesis protein NfuA [Aminicella lysinilytica]